MPEPAPIPPPTDADYRWPLHVLYSDAVVMLDSRTVREELRVAVRRCHAAEARVRELEGMLASAMGRIGQQSELLSRRAERA